MLSLSDIGVTTTSEWFDDVLVITFTPTDGEPVSVAVTSDAVEELARRAITEHLAS